jgi:RimJ/RimL family protein N-acetyltransferase
MEAVAKIQPNLEVQLSPMISEALPLVLSWAKKPENAEFFRRFPPMCDWLCTNRALEIFKDAYLISESDRYVGLAVLHSADPYGHCVDVGLLVDTETSLQRSKTAITAGDQLCMYAFNFLRMHKVSSRILSHRLGLKAHLESSGFKQEGYLRESIWYNHKYHDEIIMSCLAVEFICRS